MQVKTRLLEVPETMTDHGDADGERFPDERLELIFTCCHPALSPEAQVALTLRTLGGLTTDEIADAFLPRNRRWPSGWCVRNARSRQQVSRSVSRPTHLLPDRLEAVLAVVYLIFNEGYGGRVDLAAEAIRLGRALAELMPDEPEAQGLLSLMLLHDARRDARFAEGELVLLADQDRRLWNERQIAEGRRILDRALALHGRGSYVLQAAIAALHTEDQPDHAEIAALYGELARLTGSPVVEVNRAVAVAEASGADDGLDVLAGVDLSGYRYFHAARAELLRRAGREPEAAAEYDLAIALTPEGPELRHLRRRLAQLTSQPR